MESPNRGQKLSPCFEDAFTPLESGNVDEDILLAINLTRNAVTKKLKVYSKSIYTCNCHKHIPKRHTPHIY
jgi:hypothetical protein